MKVIWIRHATTDRESGGDTLDNAGCDYAERLPDLLKTHDIMPEIVFVDRSEPEAQRCDCTVAKVIESGSCAKELKRKDVRGQLNFCASLSVSVVAICYMSVSLKHMPRIYGAPKDLEKWMDDPSLSKPPCSITDWLYENILVSEFSTEGLKFVCKIPTGNSRSN
jgi:hypothetical protein